MPTLDLYKKNSFLAVLIRFVVWLAEAVLILRIVFRLFSANPNASFVHWIYKTSNTLLEPFRGIFPNAVIHNGYVLDFTALFALVMYAIAGAVLIFFIELIEHSIPDQKSNPKTK